MVKGTKVTSPHESGVRSMIQEAHGQAYAALQSLAEAKTFEDAYVIFEGDYGGQIYLVAPAAAVQCAFEDLNVLLADIDRAVWDDSLGASVYFERMERGSIVAGGMEGGVAEAATWVHPKLHHLRASILAVLAGEQGSLSCSAAK